MEEDSIYSIDPQIIEGVSGLMKQAECDKAARSKFLHDVEKLVNGQRQLDYGEAKKNFQRIATLWNIYLDGDDLNPQDVAIMMILHKISRLKTSKNHRDSWLDIAGYSCLAGTM